MTHRHNLQPAPCLDPVENPIPIKPEFPRSDGIGSEPFLVPRLEFRVRLQVSNDPGHDDPLLMGFEVSNVTLRAFCERDPIPHASMVSEKPSPLKMLAERGRDAATSDCGASAAVSRHGPPGEVSRRSLALRTLAAMPGYLMGEFKGGCSAADGCRDSRSWPQSSGRLKGRAPSGDRRSSAGSASLDGAL